MNKHKRGNNFNSNQMMQWAIIALIAIVVFNALDINIWAFWWIPFMFYWMSGCGKSHSEYHDDSKSKNDDIDYV